MKIGAGRVRSDVAHLYSLKDHGHGVLSEPKIMARRARTPENEACELGVALTVGFDSLGGPHLERISSPLAFHRVAPPQTRISVESAC